MAANMALNSAVTEVHKIREAKKIMGCFEDYMQFRDEVEEAKMRMKGKEPAKKAVAEKASQRAEKRLPGTDHEAEELPPI